MELTSKEQTVARNIAKFTNRISRTYGSANASERLAINTAIAILNQAQMLVPVDLAEARKLLAAARRIGLLEDARE